MAEIIVRNTPNCKCGGLLWGIRAYPLEPVVYYHVLAADADHKPEVREGPPVDPS